MTRIMGSDWLAKMPAHGRHVVTATEASANQVVIDTAMPEATGFLVQVWANGVDVTSDAVVTLNKGALTVADGSSTYNVTEGQVINWIVFKD